ncbi:MAG: hypothetical protein IPN76_06800 [Saprospiraceae bacterium]|nr:hypothetical protein [Saprospiraceae bacterium]
MTAIDNCGQAGPASLAETFNGTGCNRTLTRTWTATDSCGNSVTASQTIALSDTEPPVFAEASSTKRGAAMPLRTFRPRQPSPQWTCDGDLEVAFQQNQTGTGCDDTPDSVLQPGH